MIYLLRKHDIISVPSYAAGIYHRSTVRYHIEDISPVPSGTDIIVKNLFCRVDKRGFLHAKDYLNGAELRSESPKVVQTTIHDPDEDHSKRKLLPFPASAVGIPYNMAFSWNELHNATSVRNRFCIV